MDSVSISVDIAVIVVTAGWFFYYAWDVKLKGLIMTRVLVPVGVLEGKTVSSGLMTLLGTMDVTVLGYHVLPEQTPPDQARLQYEERANSALENLSQEFRTAGGAADHRLVFTHNREQTVNRIAEEVDARAFAISGITGDVDRLLVSLSGDVAIDRILTFVGELVGDRDISVTLFLATKEEPTGADRLDSAAERLRDAGVDIRTERVVSGSPFDALIESVPDHDAIVMGENAPSFRSLVFGQKADHVVVPVANEEDARTPEQGPHLLYHYNLSCVPGRISTRPSRWMSSCRLRYSRGERSSPFRDV